MSMSTTGNKIIVNKAHNLKKAELRMLIARGIQARKELDVIEQYERLMGVGTPEESSHSATVLASGELRTMTKGDAAAAILKEKGAPMKVRAIYNVMKEAGHPVRSVEALRTLLEKDSRFKRVRRGEYGA